MAARDEQVAQIEAALRRRFFPLVHKIVTPERANWTEANHDTDRLSRSLAAFTLVGLCDLDDAAAAGAITDGRDDGGIDALHFDQARNRLVVVQAKFKRGGEAPDQADVLKSLAGIRSLQARRFHEFNQHFQNRLDVIEQALDTPGVILDVALTYLGDNIGPHATTALDTLKQELNVLTERMVWNGCGLPVVHGWLLGEQEPEPVTIDLIVENWASVNHPRKAIYGQITAAALAQLVADKDKALFQRNIRHYLGSIGVNTAIERTVRHQPGEFFYLNNGITAVAETITQGGGDATRCVFGLTNASIVNGAQTAGTVAAVALQAAISADAKLLVTIIELGPAGSDLGLRITKARNYQNVVRSVDFAALDPTQERLRQELAAIGVTYHYRPSAEARVRRDDAFTIEEAAVALACLGFSVKTSAQILAATIRGETLINAIELCVSAKKEVSRLWDQDGAVYPRLFNDRLSGLRLCRLVNVFRFVDQVCASTELAETRYYRRMFFRHGRYFVMAFVALRAARMLNQPAHTLSQDDKDQLSRMTNELAELIYAASEPLQGYRGYLAVFRNLTDAQPLADQVIQRLAAPAAAPVPAAPTGPAVADPAAEVAAVSEPGIVPVAGENPAPHGAGPAGEGPTTPGTDDSRGTAS